MPQGRPSVRHGDGRHQRRGGLGRCGAAPYGARLVDKDGNITVKSDETKQVLEWFKKLVPVLPPDVFAWDDASNNKA